MTDPASDHPPAVQGDLADLLDQLDKALTRQIELIRADRIEAVGELGARVDTLLVAINTHRPKALSAHAVAIA